MLENYVAVIQAGGKGTRLKELTRDEIPKPLLEINGKPMIEWQIENALKYGIQEFVLIIGHLGEKIKDYFQDGARLGIHIDYIEEKEPLYSGINGYAGEIGHTIIEVNGRPCPCGNHGCLEQYVSERALLQQLANKKNMPKISYSQFVDLYEQHDKDALDLIEDFIQYMTICVNNVLNMFNPDLVIINSHFVVLNPDLINRIELGLSSRMNNFQKIVPSALQSSSVLLGGISIVIRRFLGVDIFLRS